MPILHVSLKEYSVYICSLSFLYDVRVAFLSFSALIFVLVLCCVVALLWRLLV